MEKKRLLSGYFASLANVETKERYFSKLSFISRRDPYEISREDFKDDVELWPLPRDIQSCRNVSFIQGE